MWKAHAADKGRVQKKLQLQATAAFLRSQTRICNFWLEQWLSIFVPGEAEVERKEAAK